MSFGDRDQAMSALMRREYMLRKTRDLKAPKCMMDNATRMVEEARQALVQFGISDADYKAFVDANWLDFQGREITYEHMNGCIWYMRKMQADLAAGITDLDPCIHANDCNIFCKKYQKATPEQEARFLNGIDVDTGEELPEVDLPWID